MMLIVFSTISFGGCFIKQLKQKDKQKLTQI